MNTRVSLQRRRKLHIYRRQLPERSEATTVGEGGGGGVLQLPWVKVWGKVHNLIVSTM